MIRILRTHPGSRILAGLLTILMINLTGCYYYKVIPGSKTDISYLATSQQQGKTTILHFGPEVWEFHITSIEGTDIKGEITNLVGHTDYLETNRSRVNRYRVKGDDPNPDVINEVHIFISEYSPGDGNTITIPSNAITGIDIYDKAVGATVGSWIFTGAMIGLGAFALFLIILFLTKSSCPFIYLWNGEFFDFRGEIYSGAIQPGLERYDYMSLGDPTSEDGMVKIKMTNEVKEIQHTNLTRLRVFNHPNNTELLVDKYGDHHTIREPEAPVEARSLSGRDILQYVENRDSLVYFGDPIDKDPAILDGTIMTFNKPTGTGSAKLVVRAKNSMWLDYLFTRFHGMFGSSYDSFRDQQGEKSSSELNSWYLEQNFPLSLYMLVNDEWKFIDYYNLAGPMAQKDDILMFDLPATDENTVTLKLETGYLFWEIDYAAMDFTADEDVKYEIVPLSGAVDKQGIDHREELINDDGLYYVQENVGDEIILEFNAGPSPDTGSRTVILESKGYYTILRQQSGKMDKKKLRSFREKNRFPRYSLELYKQLAPKYSNEN